MWYNHLGEYLIRKKGYVNDPICPCIFFKQLEFGIAIVAVYIDDLNLIRTPEELQKTTECLKNEFEMKDLGKTMYCLGLQTEHWPNGIFIHQSTYTEKIWKHFNMDKN